MAFRAVHRPCGVSRSSCKARTLNGEPRRWRRRSGARVAGGRAHGTRDSGRAVRYRAYASSPFPRSVQDAPSYCTHHWYSRSLVKTSTHFCSHPLASFLPPSMSICHPSPTQIVYPGVFVECRLDLSLRVGDVPVELLLPLSGEELRNLLDVLVTAARKTLSGVV